MARRLLIAIILLLALAIASVARAGDVVIVLSDKGGVYGEFASAFQQFTEGSNWRVRATVGADGLDAASRADLVIAVGAEATRACLRRLSNTPVVATLLPRQAYERALADTAGHRSKGTTTAIFLDQPIARLFAFTRHLLPERHRVGLLAGPETRPLLPHLRQAAAATGLGIEIEEMDNDVNPVPGLNLLLPRSDLLLALPDGAVYRRDNIRAILLTSYRYQRPVIGFSQALVTAGALAAIYSTPTQIARQAVDLIKPLHPESISLPAPQAPALFAISLNPNVAQALGLTLPDEAAIRRSLAADKDAK